MPINILKGALLFGLLGPSIGWLTIAVPAMVMARDWSLALVLMLPAAYFVGVIPAVIAGFIVGMVRPNIRGVRAYLLAAIIDAICSAAYLAAVTSGDVDFRQIGLLAFLPGFAAGLVCGYIFLKPPNNSFKPNPLRGSA